MIQFIGEFLGYLAGVCTAVCFLPQTVKTIKTKNVQGLSWLSYAVYSLGIFSWICYGFYLHSVQMILFNAISLVFASIILFMILKGQKRGSK